MTQESNSSSIKMPPLSSSLDLTSCTAVELVQYLKDHRFGATATAVIQPKGNNDDSSNNENKNSLDHNEDDIVSFLKSALEIAQSHSSSTTVVAATSATTTSTNDNQDDKAAAQQQQNKLNAVSPPLPDASFLGERIQQPFLETAVVSCSVPRCGKIQLQLYQYGVQAVKNAATTPTNKNATSTVDAPSSTIVWTMGGLGSHRGTDKHPPPLDRILIVPNPNDLKQRRKVISSIVIALSESSSSSSSSCLLSFKEKPYSQVVWSLTPPAPPSKPKKSKESSDIPEDDCNNQNENPTPPVSYEQILSEFDQNLDQMVQQMACSLTSKAPEDMSQESEDAQTSNKKRRISVTRISVHNNDGTGGANNHTMTTKTTTLTIHNNNNNNNNNSTAKTKKTKNVFTSFQDPHRSTTTGGLPFVSCYQGTKDGVLYPLEKGLLFASSSLANWQFYPRRLFQSIAAGRGTGGNSRYIDLQVNLVVDPDTTTNTKDTNVDDTRMTTATETATTKVLEFTNIDREEMNGLNRYIHECLIPALQQDAANNHSKATTEEEEDSDKKKNNDEDDDEATTSEEMEDAAAVVMEVSNDDDDDNVLQPSDVASGRGGGRGSRPAKRRASLEAYDAIRKRTCHPPPPQPKAKPSNDGDEDDTSDDEVEDPDFDESNELPQDDSGSDTDDGTDSDDDDDDDNVVDAQVVATYTDDEEEENREEE